MKAKHIFYISLFLILLSTPLLAVSIKYKSLMGFDPITFSNKYIDFLFQLISIFTSFILLNLFWESQQRKRQTSLIQNRLYVSLTRLRRLTKDTKDFLNLRISDTEERIVQQREEMIIQKFNQLNTFREGISALTLEGEIDETRNLSAAADIFWATLTPIINDLSKREKIYPDTDEINQKLDELLEGITTILHSIRQ
ncbi:MAG: hypothetical protein HY864_17150 [Chloroflexi bacterium]|nr:hypothetical protein [Chloroflexota bacterium]